MIILLVILVALASYHFGKINTTKAIKEVLAHSSDVVQMHHDTLPKGSAVIVVERGKRIYLIANSDPSQTQEYK